MDGKEEYKNQPLQTENYLEQSAVHADWEAVYLSPETERFYDRVFEELEPYLKKGKILDAGCGTGVLSVRLAKVSRVTAVDVSGKALKAAGQRVAQSGYADRITLQKENLCALSFADGSFPVVFCWGVLMHIPDVEKALAELMRVTAQGGYLIIGENNRRSWQGRVTRLLGRGTYLRVAETPAGREHWYRYADGDLVARHADIGWLKRQAESKGFALKKQTAAQFSELYARVGNKWLRRRLHALNRFWFWLGWAGPALGNLLIWEKTSDG